MNYGDPSITWMSIEEFQRRQTAYLDRVFACSKPSPSSRRMGLKDDPPKRSLADLQVKPVEKLNGF